MPEFVVTMEFPVVGHGRVERPGPDRLLADRAAARVASLRATRAALAALAGPDLGTADLDIADLGTEDLETADLGTADRTGVPDPVDELVARRIRRDR